MAVFGLQQIRRYVGDQAVYLRGTESYAAGGVTAVSRTTDGGYGEQITAAVRGRGNQPASHPAATFDAGGGLLNATCDCGPFHRTGAPCKHIAALLTYKYYADMVAGTAANGSRLAGETAPVADHTADALIGAYRQAGAAAATVAAPHTLRVEPVLDLTGGRPAVGLTIGEDRLYVVKDLSRFAEQMARHAVRSYGQLTVVHHEDAFSPDSLPLLRTVLSLVRSAGEGIGRFCPLHPADLSQLLLCLRERTVTVRYRQREQTLSLRQENPHPTLTVTRAQAAIRVTARPFGVWQTAEGLLMLTDEGLFATDGAYRAATAPLWRALTASRYSLTMDTAIFADFCAAVLPAVKGLITVEDADDLIGRFTPPTPRLSFFLDAPDPRTVTVTRRFEYPDGDTAPNKPAEDRATALLGRHLAPTDDPAVWRLSTEDDDILFAFLKTGIPALREAGDVLISDALAKVEWRPATRPAVSVRMHANWMDLAWSAEWPAEDWQGILQSVRRKKTYHRLKNGQFLELTGGVLTVASLMEQWQLSADALHSGHARLPAYAAAYAVPLLKNDGWRVDADRLTADWLDRLCRPDLSRPLPAALCADLRPYQREGFCWLKSLQECGVGGILADDMGLGKTVQMIALLVDAKEREGAAPSLITCPASLVFNWYSELRRFAPTLSVVTVSGSAAARQEAIAAAGAADVVITSYDLLRRDAAWYADMTFRYHLVDEAQYIKNDHTLNARAVKFIRSERRFAVTGTPIENRLGELWSIFDFLMPGFLSSYRRFRDRYEIPIAVDHDAAAAARLRGICAPFILHRAKQDVLTELPPKQETVITVPMTDHQRRLYRANLAEAKAAVGQMHTGADRIRILALLTRLRQICCDPSLCYDGYAGGSGKLDACVSLLQTVIADGHKVLVFSQFTSLLERLAERLSAASIAFRVLRGSTPSAARVDLVERFNADETPVFLISLKAGGTGLNLVGADVVIHFDPWWNRSVQDQATDRAHRIGQAHPVTIYKLVCADSVEQQMMALQDEKTRLSDAVLPGSRAGDALSPETLRRLFASDTYFEE